MKAILVVFFTLRILIITAQVEMKNLSVDTVFQTNKDLNGMLNTHLIKSDILNEVRTIDIYRPPNYLPNKSYGLLFVTDGVSKGFAGEVETLIESNLIEPIIIVSVQLRRGYVLDSIEKISMGDFRNFEYLKGFQSKDSIYAGTAEWEMMQNRYSRFSAFIKEEVIPYVLSTNNVTLDHEKWAIGGYSNGGAFVISFSAENPKLFRNIIGMSPGYNDRASGYEFPNDSPCFYYFCGGTDEKPFLQSTLRMLPRLKEKNISYLHYTYNSGHDWLMWYSFYRVSLLKIYG